ncbi:MAG TPA: MFS transporter, partial [Burkholderiaceae bacterium]
GLKFVSGTRLLVALAAVVGCWQMFHQAAMVVNILFATRVLGLNEQQIGGCFVALGAGTVLASVFGNRLSRRIGPGPSMPVAIGVCAVGWLLLAVAPANAWGVAAFALMLFAFGVGAVLIFINFLAMRQAVTPEPLLGRMTSTMRWLILIPAGPGALIGGWLGEHAGLRAALAFSGVGGLVLAGVAAWLGTIRQVRVLPKPEGALNELGSEATLHAPPALERG